MLMTRLAHVSHARQLSSDNRQLSSDNAGQPVAPVSALTLVAFDPAELKLSTRTYETGQLNGVFGALRDAGPDYWGRRVIEKYLASLVPEEEYIHRAPYGAAEAFGLHRLYHA